MKSKPTLKQLMEITQLSRATIDRALNDRPGVHPRTRHAVEAALKQLGTGSSAKSAVRAKQAAYDFRLLAQAGDAFTDELIRTAIALEAEFDANGVRLEVERCVGESDEEVAARIRKATAEVDGIGIICTNTATTSSALRECMAAGKPVVTLITDVDADARHTYVGVNNRAAGQSAAFLLGRHLQAHASPDVAVIVATFSYTCHEDREIGFRSLLRQRFPHVNLVEVIKGADSGAATYEATTRFLKAHGKLDGIYNVAGGNEGLAAALREHNLTGRTLYVTHEVNRITEPLLRSDAIDYLLTQDMRLMLRTAVDHLKAAREGAAVPSQAIIPIETYSRYSLY
ncbi:MULTISPECIES: substrate-binding domain-containing protein [Paraburkholderia]|jgi:LacI family transcriptional regulator|uniref:LacI family transcriptional regulator n=1 Tax=Paraburkholderia largidicola TaxID=3014751 RepID=A0A7I8BXD4_9BURK|nr:MULTISPECIES: substrate-binding domain-containing protein [Paraburkholderia]BCF93446.1 LacI family transcriptional regulator [Paraburkholderia sp. PGU16]BEU26623.1 substrate-binding domain-containing protein [Paraburkholderia sp. 22B1P]GJH05425.1 substrate-binding domain-containing protein [Paraburkholderia terrae]